MIRMKTIEEQIKLTIFSNYFISNIGKVYSNKSGELKELKQLKLPNGYMQVHLSKDRGRKTNMFGA